MADKRGSLMVNGYKVGGKVDTTLSSTSTNPIENQAIFNELKKYGVKFTYVDNTLTLVSNDGTALSTTTIQAGSNFNIPNVTNIVASKGNAIAELTWTDPNDISYEGVTLAKWGGTIVVQRQVQHLHQKMMVLLCLLKLQETNIKLHHLLLVTLQMILHIILVFFLIQTMEYITMMLHKLYQ